MRTWAATAMPLPPDTPAMLKSPSPAVVSPVRIITIVAVALVALYTYGLIALYGNTPGWLIDNSGLPRSNEYVGVRAAGQLARDGHAASAYDWADHEAQTAVIIGRPVKAYFPYPYPPTYFFIAAALASLPYVLSALLWIGTTLSLYAFSVWRITGMRITALWAIASPASVFNAFVAHTSFWTAASMGLALDALPRRPLVAGALFGLLTLKPQFGLLVPIALVAGGYWRTIFAAACTAALLALASVAVFGLEPWLMFPAQMTRISDSARFGHDRFGDINFNILVTAYGFLRAWGLPDIVALGAHATLAVALAAGTALLWRSRAPDALKAAGLASASLLVTPYLFIYDLTHLSIAIAFLVRHCGLAGLSRNETVMLGVAVLLILPTLVVPLPVGFVANAGVGCIIALRVWPYLKHADAKPVAGDKLHQA